MNLIEEVHFSLAPDLLGVAFKDDVDCGIKFNLLRVIFLLTSSVC